MAGGDRADAGHRHLSCRRGTQLAAGVAAHHAPDWRVLRDFGLQSTSADADYFAKTLPQIAANDIGPAHREALQRELQAAGNDAAAAYRHLHDYIATTFFVDPRGGLAG